MGRIPRITQSPSRSWGVHMYSMQSRGDAARWIRTRSPNTPNFQVSGGSVIKVFRDGARRALNRACGPREHSALCSHTSQGATRAPSTPAPIPSPTAARAQVINRATSLRQMPLAKSGLQPIPPCKLHRVEPQH